MVFQWFVFSRSAGQIRTWGASGCLSNWLFSTCLLVPWFRSLSQWNAWTMVLWSLNTKAKDVYKYILWDRNGDILGWAVGRLYGFKNRGVHSLLYWICSQIKKCVSVFIFCAFSTIFSKASMIIARTFPMSPSVVSCFGPGHIFRVRSWTFLSDLTGHIQYLDIIHQETEDEKGNFKWTHLSKQWTWSACFFLGGCEQTKRNDIPQPCFWLKLCRTVERKRLSNRYYMILPWFISIWFHFLFQIQFSSYIKESSTLDWTLLILSKTHSKILISFIQIYMYIYIVLYHI